MDGKVLASMYQAEWLWTNAPRYVERDIEGDVGGGIFGRAQRTCSNA